jgi:hypothetical protein
MARAFIRHRQFLRREGSIKLLSYVFCDSHDRYDFPRGHAKVKQ